CIAATTPAEFRKSIEKDRSLERRFQAVKVPPPNEDDAIKILFGIKDRYEKFHAVSYTDDSIEAAVYTSSRYIPDRFLPDKAIDLIDEELHKRIISQEKAISALARAIRRSRAGLKSSARPAGSFLFLGPTGVGKTEVARALAAFLFGSEKSLVRFDMSEFMEKHSV